ncbi:hypothetical protein F2Q69_00062910 [Brassica cretica]|uniref:Uncharacterized protein n=1 Tax=Brassica cretica TaxID=69181 RepID=A0A8S9RM37_BRACR|nr:hypothetical protein F2Q69_00062910 [Brassica cretica]
MLSVIRVHLPSEIPIVGCELTPYVLVCRPDKSAATDDVPESAPLDGYFLRYRWYRVQSDKKVTICSVHPTQQATLQCVFCSKRRSLVSKSYHCSPKCFVDAWQHHKTLHEAENGNEEDELVRFNSIGSGVLSGTLSGSMSNLSLASNGPTPFYPSSISQKSGGETLVEVGSCKTYTPTADDIGYVLKFECAVANAESKQVVGHPSTILTSRVPTPPPLPPSRSTASASQSSTTDTTIGASSAAALTTFAALSMSTLTVIPPVQPGSTAPLPPQFPSPPPGFVMPTSLMSLTTSSTATTQSSSGQVSGFAGASASNSDQQQFYTGPRFNPLFGQSSVSSGSSPAFDLTRSLGQMRLSSTPAPAVLSDDRLSELWDEIDNYDLSGIDADAFKIFEYQGFNPSMMLNSIKVAADERNIDKDTMMMDIIYMCVVAAIKGSVNDHNISRMGQAAVARIQMLEERYNVKRGGGRGEPPHVVTFSRVASSFPGKIMQLLDQKKIPARDFIGPMKSNALPAVMRHQAFAAVIPSSLKERVREFLLTLATAFSVDQSYCIRADKKVKFVIEEVFERQRNFIQITANAKYPKEQVRIGMFKQLQLEHDSLTDCARAVQSKFPDFRILSREKFVQAMTDLH